MTVMCLGFHAGGSLDRPGNMFSEGVMSSISHELEQMMHRFFLAFSTPEALVTMLNGYSIKHSQHSPSNTSQSDSLNFLIFIMFQT